MKTFSLLIKPAAADCNLRCDYCFYLKKKALYPDRRTHRMSGETLRATLRAYFDTPQPVYSMIWQGGEPSLMGTGFFKSVTELQKQLAPKGARIANSIQTNATRVGDSLAAHLGRYRFLAGCSIDGPPDLHDRYRRTVSGRPSHALVLRGLETLRRHSVPVNAVTLVSNANVEHARRVFIHLLELGFSNMQFIPCVEFNEQGRSLPYSISAEQWGRFLLEVFELWYSLGDWRVSVRNFDSIIGSLALGVQGECRLCESCDQYLVVEYNGDVFPCDFHVSGASLLGNIYEDSLRDIRRSMMYKTFAKQKQRIPSACRSCDYYSVCMGDCPKFRLQDKRGKHSLLCAGWRFFFDAAWERLLSLSRMVAAGQPGGSEHGAPYR